MHRRSFLQAPLLAAVAHAARAATEATAMDLPLEEATIDQIGSALRDGRTSALALVHAYGARVASLDRTGPTLRSVIELNPEATAIAQSLDDEARAGRWRGPLHGVPIVVKDNIASADRMQTSAGSPALMGAQAPRDAFVVQRLRAAGAVLLGKTNLSEWANIRGAHSSSGWSTRGGQTLNPYALDRSPSGSSSGTGTAVAASLCAAGVGTETDGSITSPSSVQALVGIKPTVGLLSRDGVIPISFTQDTPGPMCRSVRDAALLLAAMAGSDARDPATRAADKRLTEMAFERLDAHSLRGVRLGIATNLAGTQRDVVKLFEQAQAALKALGAELVEAAIPHTEKYQQSELDVLLTELKHAMPLYLREFAANLPHRTLADLIAYNRAHAAETMPLFGQELFEQAQAKGGIDSAPYRKALNECQRYARTLGIDAVLKSKRVSALIAPTGDPAWLIDPVNGDAVGASATSPPAVAGYPHVTVPMGQATGGLPVGLSFIGPAWSDARLLNYAYAYEQATQQRKPPTYQTSSSRR
ncbi:MAG TPA: amidase [Burkholderiaceae bacterium]|nr:amidase [Burkholderiaceae bacterium]